MRVRWLVLLGIGVENLLKILVNDKVHIGSITSEVTRRRCDSSLPDVMMVVVYDASPFNYLVLIGQIDLLPRLFGDVNSIND